MTTPTNFSQFPACPTPCHPVSVCPKFNDCTGPFCYPCLSCNYPEIYAKVICCYYAAVNKVIVSTPNPKEVTEKKQDQITRMEGITKYFLSALEKVCECFTCGVSSCNTKPSKKFDACDKKEMLFAMAEVICCVLTQTVAELVISNSNWEESPAKEVEVVKAQLKLAESTLGEMIRCACGCAPAPAPVCSPCNTPCHPW